MKYNILILNAGTRNKIIQYFKEVFQEHGKVVVTDNYYLAPALYEGDSYYLTKRCQEDGYIDEIIDIVKKEKIKGIISLLDPDLTVISKNRERLEREGALCFLSDYQAMKICFDKYETYKILKKNDISCAKTYGTLEEFEQALHIGAVAFPVYCKPRCGSGSTGVEKVESLQRVKELFYFSKDYIVQEFMQGQEIGADVYVDYINGKMTTAFLKKKLKMRSGETDKSISYKNDFIFEMLEQVISLLHFRGPIDVDIFEEDDKIYISEINPRFGGGYPHAYECGINMPQMILNNMMGLENEICIGKYKANIYMMKYFDVVMKEAGYVLE